MSRYYQRPENALKKANEFIEVGKPTRALDTLYDVIKGKKHRAFTEKVIEPIMLKYLELCVELKKPHTAKEGLYQYRLMCQSVNVGLLEKVIRCFLKMAEEKTEAAKEAIKKEAVETTDAEGIVEVDDLDNLSMAEMTLLNVITEEQAQERSDRATLIPWVKFLWESYTQCLDLLRNNARLEGLYHDIAQMAFKFCLSFNRKTEFRKLCERLRKHFEDILVRQGSQINAIDFSSPETQQLNMETRLAQLDSAITMELWQEAYKAIEDIHLLMNQSKKLQTRMMAYYYQKLSLVFWKAGNLLFHAATLLKYYLLCKDMKKNVSAEELQKNASQVALATLAIPFPVAHPEFERFVETDKGMIEKSQKLSMLLFLPQPPTRASLIKDLTRYGVLSNAISPLGELHEVLETQFNPLGLCSQVENCLNKLKTFADHEYIDQYVIPVQDVALCRLIKQISQVYQNIDYNHLLKLSVFADLSRIEQILVDAVRYSDMQINIDHRTNCVKFGSAFTEASRDDELAEEGPQLQAMPSETIRLQLVNVINYLDNTMNMISPVDVQDKEDSLREKIARHYLSTERTSHLALLQRQKVIADRREELERNAADRENEEKWRNEQMIRKHQALEAERIEAERETRERRRIEQELEKIQKSRLRERFNQIKNSPLAAKVIPRLEDDDISKIDMDSVILQQQAELAKEAKEQLARMKSQEKRIDHLERAKRMEEVPIIKKYVDDKKAQEKVEWEAHENERITHLIEERGIAVATRDRMKRMRGDKEKFLKTLLEGRRSVYEEKVKRFEDVLANARADRLQKRREDRKEDRRQKYIQQVEEEERRRQEEQRKEEEERMKEERERMEKENEERKRISLEKQMAKMREIEEREAERGVTVNVKQPGDVWRPPSRDQRPGGGVGAPTTPATPAAAAASAAQAPGGGSGEKSGVWVPVWKRKGGRDASPEGPPPPQRRIEREPPMEREQPRRNLDDSRDRGERSSFGGERDNRDRDSMRGDWDRGTPRSAGAPPPATGTPRPMDRDRERVQGEDSWRRGGGGGERGSPAGQTTSPRPSGGPGGPGGFTRGDRDRDSGRDRDMGRERGGDRDRDSGRRSDVRGGDRDGGGFSEEGSWRSKKQESAAPIRK